MTEIQAGSVEPIAHDEAMEITSAENDRVEAMLRDLEASDWARQTDCERWDVRAMTLHIIGSADSQASIREFVHQMRVGRTLMEEIGGVHWVDGLNEVQIRERAHLPTPELPDAWRAAADQALAARRKMPGLIRALPILPLGPPVGRKPVGYLFDMGFTRDAWMHRVDIANAIGRPMEVTPEHDGRIMADIVREWADTHGEPFTLHLTGPAGGTFVSGTGGETVEIDALDFARTLCGRLPGTGVLRHPLPL